MDNEVVKKVRREIKKLSESQDRLDNNEIRVVIALERAIARVLCDKKLSKCIVFKGGFVLLKDFHSIRYTRDIDALATMISKNELKDLVIIALQTDLDDSLWYGDIHVDELDEQGEYGTYRFDMAFQIGEPDLKKIHKLSRIHFDIGFSDRLINAPKLSKMLSILPDQESISWSVYPVEQIVSEKLQTFFERGSANSRAKDIYDLWFLLPRCHDDGVLRKTIINTFQNRGTPIPKSFYVQAKNMDVERLQFAWSSVKIMGQQMKFLEVWDDLVRMLKGLD